MKLVLTDLVLSVVEEIYLFLDADREVTPVRDLSGKGLIRP